MLRRHLTHCGRNLKKCKAQTLFAALLGAAGILLAGCGNNPDSASADPSDGSGAKGILSRFLPSTVTIPEGTTLSVRMLHSVSSRSANAGDEFDGELASPVVMQGSTIFPKSTRVRGRVVSAKASGRLKDPGYLRLQLDAIQAGDGKWLNVETSAVSAQGRSHTKRNATLIGGGAGTGALIGAIAGGGKGAAIGAGVGAGAGTAGAYATGKKDVSFPVESKLSFKLLRELRVDS